MQVVADASFVLRLVLPDEAGPKEEHLRRLLSSGIIVPRHFPSEVWNGLLTARRRGRVDGMFVGRALRAIDRLPIDLDTEPFGAQARAVLDLAEAGKLTAYDAAYLELALRRDTELWTADGALALAARRFGARTLVL